MNPVSPTRNIIHMEKLSFSTAYFLGKNSAIHLRIIVNRKKAELSVKRFANERKWDAKGQNVKGDSELNAYLIHIKHQVTSIHSKLFHEGKEITAKLIKDIFLGKDEKSILLLDYLDEHILEIASLTDQYRIGTLKRYETVRKHLIEFLDSSGQRDIKLHKFNLKLINQFDHFLKTQKSIGLNSSAKYLKIFRTTFSRALRFELITSNPFTGFEFKTVQVEKEFLTPFELELLETTTLPNRSLEKVRDTFLFASYTGLRFSDVYALSPRDVKKEKDGQLWLTIKHIIKTDRALRIPLLNKAISIIEKYTDEGLINDKLMPAISNQKTNAYLKVIADLSGVDKHLTYHCARHTFATTVTLSNQVPLEVVSKLLGHSSIRSTQIYAKITDQYLSDMTTTLNKKLK